MLPEVSIAEKVGVLSFFVFICTRLQHPPMAVVGILIGETGEIQQASGAELRKTCRNELTAFSGKK
ncbi:hypothetical protein D3C79_1013870 [compost metagenome]